MTSEGTQTPADSLATAQVVAHALVDGGMRDVVICPGSRSAPLVYALAACERGGAVRLHVRIDERSAAFLAHGLSLGSGRPVGVLTTSGSAVGNLTPALMESFHAGTRVVALTADRPAALHGTGANQTTQQIGMFGPHVRAAVSVAAVHDGDAAAHLRTVRSRIAQAMLATEGFSCDEEPDAVRVEPGPPGPVHVNLEFDVPLVPDAEDLPRLARQCACVPGACPPQTGPPAGLDARPTTGALPDLSAHGAAAVRAATVPVWRPAGADLSGFPELEVTAADPARTVVLAGHDAGPVAAAFALALGLPLLAEPSSNARFSVNAIAAYPLLLGPSGGLDGDGHPLSTRIERVVLFGRPTLTRPVQALLARPDVQTALYAPEPAPWHEPGARREREVGTLAELAQFAGHGDHGWLSDWQQASLRAQNAVDDVVVTRETDSHLTPHTVALALASTVRGPLVLGSSSVIRDVDLTWRPPGAPQTHVYANRGLAGIDGTISTAAGVALATQRRTVALMGDLTALHDAGGLLVGEGEPEPDVDVVVVNDAGGAIFAGLEHGEVAREPHLAPIVERFFGTPHEADLEALAAAYAVPYQRLRSATDLHNHLSRPARGRRLFEVRCDRADRPAVTARLAAAVRSTFPAGNEDERTVGV